MIGAEEQRRFLAVPLCGRRVVARLEAIGVERLEDLRGRDPWDLLDEVNLAAGRPVWRPPMAVRALTNLVRAAAPPHSTDPEAASTAAAGKE